MKLLKNCLTLFVFASVFAGALLTGIGSVLLAGNNAMFDYYNGTHQQAYGWIMCFVPAAAVLIGAALFYLRKKTAWTGALGLAVMLASPLKPAAYMIIHGEFIPLIGAGAIVMFAGAIAACALSAVSAQKKMRIKK